MRADVRAGRAGRQDEHDRADPRRVGHRQGADRARDSLQLAARQEAVREGQLRGAAREPDRVRAVRLREGRVHRRAGSARRAASSWPRAARCSSTRSATSTWARRSSCCACCRSASSSGSAAPRRSRSTSGSSRRRTRTWRRRSPRARSARTSYYRLNVFTIFVPPLRDRKADLLLLADHFLEKFSREHGKIIKRISTPAIDMLMSYHWPGNVRELENALERVGAGLRRPGDSRPSPAAVAADGGGVGHRDARLADRRGRRVREGPDSGRAEDDARATGRRRRGCSTRPSGSSTTRSGSTPSTCAASRAVPRLSQRRDRKRNPARQERDASDRRDGAEDGDAGHRQQIEAAREQHDAGDEQPAGATIARPLDAARQRGRPASAPARDTSGNARRSRTPRASPRTAARPRQPVRAEAPKPDAD